MLDYSQLGQDCGRGFALLGAAKQGPDHRCRFRVHFQTSNCVQARSVDPPTTDMRRLHRQVRPGPDILGEVLPPQVFGASRKVWTRSIPANILRARRRARLRTFRFAATDAVVSALAALSYGPGYADVP